MMQAQQASKSGVPCLALNSEKEGTERAGRGSVG